MKTNKRIVNCGVRFRFQCPLSWDDLQTSEDSKIRTCNVCERQVFFCSSDEETMVHAEQGNCIARQIPDSSELPYIVLGEPEVPVTHSQEQEIALELSHREHNISDALKNLKHTSRRCADCDFPFPDWWKQCRVCSGTNYITNEK